MNIEYETEIMPTKAESTRVRASCVLVWIYCWIIQIWVRTSSNVIVSA